MYSLLLENETKRGLAIREKALGQEHPDVAQSLNKLAELYDDQGRYAEAQPLYKAGASDPGKVLGPEHADVAWSLNDLAHLDTDQGRYAEAEPLLPASTYDFGKGPGCGAPRRGDMPGKLRALSASHRPFSGSRTAGSSCEGNSG